MRERRTTASRDRWKTAHPSKSRGPPRPRQPPPWRSMGRSATHARLPFILGGLHHAKGPAIARADKPQAGSSGPVAKEGLHVTALLLDRKRLEHRPLVDDRRHVKALPHQRQQDSCMSASTTHCRSFGDCIRCNARPEPSPVTRGARVIDSDHCLPGLVLAQHKAPCCVQCFVAGEDRRERGCQHRASRGAAERDEGAAFPAT